MPIYEYECDSCAIRFEKRQSFHDEPVVNCPNCSGKVSRVICPAPIIFKGSGFYVNDYKKPSPTTEPSKEPVKAGKSAETAKATTKEPAKEKAKEAS
ncbi:MAG: zinc ribbon domain-containing protein [Chloroflexi bacterium]|nr:zinc ribbon domain-containing protein [Chloroflexota bacterium]